MKKAQREVYLNLSSEVSTYLCSFCKFCNSGKCHHLLPVVSDRLYDLVPTEDCWGFQPILPISAIRDIVGIVLAKGWIHWSYSLPASNNDKIEVFGDRNND